MQFAPAITEYVLPGLPLTAALAYLFYRLSPLKERALSLSEVDPALLAVAGLVFVGVSYMLGVLVHRAGREIFHGVTSAAEREMWRRFGRYCSRVAFARRGDDGTDDWPDDSGEDVQDGGTPQAKPDAGWILWRMRLHLCHHSPGCAQEIFKLQSIARAGRGALALPTSLVIWVLADVVAPDMGSLIGDWPLLLARLILAAVLLLGVGWTYRYRWGVVCRATIAGYLSSLPTTPQHTEQRRSADGQ